MSSLPTRKLVTGDVIQLEEGDKISADGRLVESQSFYVDVSILTGESLPVSRSAEPVAENIRASDAANLIFAGSTVAAGRGVAVVFATGTHTEFGQVAPLDVLQHSLIWLGIAVEWVLMLSIIYSPTLRKIFTTASLQPWQYLALLACPPLVLMADELRKRFLKLQKVA